MHPLKLLILMSHSKNETRMTQIFKYIFMKKKLNWESYNKITIFIKKIIVNTFERFNVLHSTPWDKILIIPKPPSSHNS